jgi:hypothetical protein
LLLGKLNVVTISKEGDKMRPRFFAAALVFGLGLLALSPASSFGIAVLNNPFGLPAGLTNAVVRIDETAQNGSNFVGSGTIIDVAPDGRGGNFYDVLTADHVVRDPNTNSFPSAVYLGFGNLNNAATFATNWPLQVNSIANNVMYGGPVDLAVFSVDVPAATPANVIPPSGILPATVATATPANGPNIIMAGYGTQGTPSALNVPPVKDAYKWVPNSYGTYISGTNVYYTATNPAFSFTTPGGYTYTYQSLQDSFALTPAGSGAAATSGTAFFLPGDSGGPTFESNGSGGLVEVGVHSAVTSPTMGVSGASYSLVGDQDFDVNIGNYQPFIVASQILVDNVPEPTSIIVIMPIAGFFLLSRRTRHVAQ